MTDDSVKYELWHDAARLKRLEKYGETDGSLTTWAMVYQMTNAQRDAFTILTARIAAFAAECQLDWDLHLFPRQSEERPLYSDDWEESRYRARNRAKAVT